MDEPRFDHPYQQQINALVALVAALIGRLRASGALSEAEMERALRTADSFVPDGSEAIGLRLLAVVREAGELAVADPLDPRPPPD